MCYRAVFERSCASPLKRVGKRALTRRDNRGQNVASAWEPALWLSPRRGN
jgi:hypothetical protein